MVRADREGCDRTPEIARTEAHAQDGRPAQAGAVIGMAGRPAQVRNPDGTGFRRIDGPFLASALPVAGFAMIEADDMEDAIRMGSGVP